MKKIGIYFGSFDPVHKGHEELVNVVLNNYCDLIIISIARKNKRKPGLIAYEHRYNMVKNTLDNDRVDIINDASLKDTLKKYQDCYIFGILGSDVYNNFVKEERNLMTKVNEWLIVPRQQIEIINSNFTFDKKTTFLDQTLFKKQMYSSTYIKNCIYNRINILNLPLHPKNIEYIKNNKLYGFQNKEICDTV